MNMSVTTTIEKNLIRFTNPFIELDQALYRDPPRGFSHGIDAASRVTAEISQVTFGRTFRALVHMFLA